MHTLIVCEYCLAITIIFGVWKMSQVLALKEQAMKKTEHCSYSFTTALRQSPFTSRLIYPYINSPRHTVVEGLSEIQPA